MTQAYYLLSALFCIAALISKGCTLVGSVLQDTVASHCAGNKLSNSILQNTSLLKGCYLNSSSDE